MCPVLSHYFVGQSDSVAVHSDVFPPGSHREDGRYLELLIIIKIATHRGWRLVCASHVKLAKLGTQGLEPFGSLRPSRQVRFETVPAAQIASRLVPAISRQAGQELLREVVQAQAVPVRDSVHLGLGHSLWQRAVFRRSRHGRVGSGL